MASLAAERGDDGNDLIVSDVIRTNERLGLVPGAARRRNAPRAGGMTVVRSG
jgi:hypothetical protein